MSLLRLQTRDKKNGTFTEYFRPNTFLSNPVSHFFHPSDVLIVSALGRKSSHILRQPEVNASSLTLRQEQRRVVLGYIYSGFWSSCTSVSNSTFYFYLSDVTMKYLHSYLSINGSTVSKSLREKNLHVDLWNRCNLFCGLDSCIFKAFSLELLVFSHYFLFYISFMLLCCKKW